VTLKFESALPGELDPELSDAYIYGPRGGVHGVDHRPEAGPSPRRYGITQAIAWRSGSIHHGETLSYAPGGPGRYARYGSGCRLPAGPTTDAILAVWTARNVRTVEAGNPSTPPEVLARLAGDVDGSVRESVAGNASAPPETLARLAGIEDHLGLVGANLASNVSTPPEVLAALAEGADRVLRRHLARNVSTPPEVLAALAVDGDFQASDFARHNPSTPIALTAA